MSSIVDDQINVAAAEQSIDPDTYRARIIWLWNHGFHFEALKLMWREKIVDCPPTRKLIKAIHSHRKLLIMGHGSASKTFTTMADKLMEWWTDPKNKAFVITSATIKSMSNRAWADLKLLVRDVAVPMPGTIMASQYKMRYDPMDDKHIVMAASGEDEDSVTKIQGLHPSVGGSLDVVIDEADNSYNVAIWKGMANLGTSGVVRIVALANPIDRNSIFGMNCEPVEGWSSIDINNSYEWESRNGYHVIRLDGLESPNIKSGKELYSFLLTQRGIDDIINEFGENSANYMTYVRAWFPDSGSVNTLFTASLVTQMEQQEIKFYAASVPVAACDPSLGGGNRCVVAIGRAGVLASDPRKGCVIIDSYHYIKVTGNEPTVTADFGRQIKELCLEHDVAPEHFIIGSSTADTGIRDYIAQDWSPDIVSMEVQGDPTNRKILQEDSRVAYERFDRRLTEVWWATKAWAQAGQLAVRQINRDLRIQLEARRWTNTSQNEISIETKKDLFKRGHKSPDEADCTTFLVELVRSKFGDLEATTLEFDPTIRRVAPPLKPLTTDRDLFEPTYKTDPITLKALDEPAMEYENERYAAQDID